MLLKKLIFSILFISSLTLPSYGMAGDHQIDELVQMSSKEEILAKSLDIIIAQDSIHHFNRLYASEIYAKNGGARQDVIDCVQSITDSDIDLRNKAWALSILESLQQNLPNQ